MEGSQTYNGNTQNLLKDLHFSHAHPKNKL